MGIKHVHFKHSYWMRADWTIPELVNTKLTINHELGAFSDHSKNVVPLGTPCGFFHAAVLHTRPALAQLACSKLAVIRLTVV
jgi:hypothetical protein